MTMRNEASLVRLRPADRLGRTDAVRLWPGPRHPCGLRRPVGHSADTSRAMHLPPPRRRTPSWCCGSPAPIWVAIDNSRNGFFVNGARLSTVDIRDGQAITIGDPQRGPRLVFRIGAPAGPPGPPPPGPPRRPPAPPPPPPVAPPPDEHEPTLRTTRRIPIPAPRPPSVQGPRQAPPTAPPPPAPLTEPAPHRRRRLSRISSPRAAG